MNPQTWWYLARASGLVAWGLLSASVVWGLLLSTRLTKGRPTPAVIFTALHLAGLVADSYVHFGIADLLVPYASSWQPAAVALGIVALYLLAAVEITSLLMRRLPRKLWHGIHLTSYAVFWLATFHLLLAGTDAANPIIRWTVAMVMAGVVFLSLVRVVSGRGGAKPTRHASTPTRPPTSQPVGAVHLASREEPPVPEDV
jgi:hypothetical protein